MAFLALKPCSFGGQKFQIGDKIPAALIRPEMVKRLADMGKIAEIKEENNAEKVSSKPRKEEKKDDQKTV